jgi:large subunit ribosomal protein L25
MTDLLHVKRREHLGSAATRRLRRSRQIPAVLYGHGEPPVHLVIPVTEVDALVRHHGKTVQLTGAVDEHALVQAVQYDSMGATVLHLDLARVRLDERVVTKLPLKLVGQAPGVVGGGMLREVHRDLEIRCAVANLPDDLPLNINDLQLGGHKTAADVQLPSGAELVTPPETVMVMVVEPHRETEALPGEAGPMEPEVITRAKPSEAAE